MRLSQSIALAITGSLVAALGLLGCGDDDDSPTPTILELVSGSSDFTTLAFAVGEAELGSLFRGRETHTVFAPTDSAFDLYFNALNLDPTALDKAILEPILRYHVIAGELSLDMVQDPTKALTTLNADAGPLSVTTLSDGTTVLDGRVRITDTIQALNGTVHVIDAVLDEGPFDGTVAQMVAATAWLQELNGAVASAAIGVDQILADASQTLTVFAPTDEAMTRFLANSDANVVTSPVLEEILRGHLVGESLNGASVVARAATVSKPGTTTTSLNTKQLRITASGTQDSTLYLNGVARILTTDIQATNGIVHIIDGVLADIDTKDLTFTYPGTLVQAIGAYPRFSSLATSLGTAGLAGTLSTDTFTVFAPEEDGFARLPPTLLSTLSPDELQEILRYHVVSGVMDAAAAQTLADTVASNGSGSAVTTLTASNNTFRLTRELGTNQLFINAGTRIIETDIVTANGRIHVIDSVLLDTDATTSGVTFPGAVVDALAAYPRFSSLVSNVIDAGLDSATNGLAGPGPFTVLAPTNDAFAALVGAPPSLSDLLSYHVLSANPALDSTDLVAGPAKATLLTGATVAVGATSVAPIRVKVNTDQATVEFADLRASNGIIHVLDNVLTLPN